MQPRRCIGRGSYGTGDMSMNSEDKWDELNKGFILAAIIVFGFIFLTVL